MFKIKLITIMTLIGAMQFSYANNKDDVSLEQASETIRKETKGKVLSATTNKYNGVKSHRIQVLTKSGRVKVYQIPANKNDKPNRYRNSDDRPNNYRNMKPNNNSYNRNKQTKQYTQSRPQYNRSNTTTLNKPSNSNGDTKKK